MLAALTFGYNFHLFLHEEIAVYAIKLYWPLCELCNASMNVMMLSVIYSRYREWCALVCDACSRNVDVDADRQKKIRSLWNVDMEKNWKISWLDKVTNEESQECKQRQANNELWQWKHRWIGHVLRHDGLLHEIIEGRMKGKPTRWRRIQLLHDWQMMVALMHSGSWGLRGMETQSKDVKNLLFNGRLQVMMM